MIGNMQWVLTDLIELYKKRWENLDMCVLYFS